MPIQVADVAKVLGSAARETVDAGDWIVVDKDVNGRCISHLECKSTGVKTAIYESNGAFRFDIKVPNGRGGGVEVARGQEVTRSEGSLRQGTLEADLFH